MGFGTFGNPLITGLGKLIRDVIQSVNFVTGVSGWAIFKDGSYEFGAGGTIRGSVTVNGADGSQIVIDGQPGYGARIKFYPVEKPFPSVPPINIDYPAFISAELNSVGGAGKRSVVSLTAPSIDWNGSPIMDGAQLNLTSADTSGTYTAFMSFNGELDISGKSFLTGDTTIGGILKSGNRITNTVSITPSAANVPTSVVVTFPVALKGTSFTCQVTPNTSAPGTAVTGVSYSGLSATGVTLWLTRTNTTATGVSYTVEGF